MQNLNYPRLSLESLIRESRLAHRHYSDDFRFDTFWLQKYVSWVIRVVSDKYGNLHLFMATTRILDLPRIDLETSCSIELHYLHILLSWRQFILLVFEYSVHTACCSKTTPRKHCCSSLRACLAEFYEIVLTLLDRSIQ